MDAGSNWGGEYSRWTFDELKQYMMVAKEYLLPGSSQGVPLLDAELNENQEIALTLIRRLIMRGFGNGTAGDFFKIVESGTNTVNNFQITGGGGTIENAAYVFVSGWMPVLLSNLEYTAQSGIAALTTPSGADRTDEVYIDVYLDEIGPTEDSNIVDSNIGYETSRRLKLTWEVNVAEGGSTPADYNDGNGVQHWTYHLATLNRLDGNANITDAMIVDKRRIVQKRSEEYIHTQGSAAASWVITHNLGISYPTVVVWDGSMNEIEPGGITVDSNNQVTIDFDGTAVSGYAKINGIAEF